MMVPMLAPILLSLALIIGGTPGDDDAALPTDPSAPPPRNATVPAENLAPGLSPDHLYNGVNRPVMLTVTAPPGQTDLTLIVLNASGQPELNAIQVRAGRIDLAEMFPDGGIWKLERAGWLQLLGSDGPIGSALV